MFNFFVLAGIFLAWFRINKAFATAPTLEIRRLRAAPAWALLGACLGSFAGFALGPIGAIAGTIPGAALFFGIGYALMTTAFERSTIAT